MCLTSLCLFVDEVLSCTLQFEGHGGDLALEFDFAQLSRIGAVPGELQSAYSGDEFRGGRTEWTLRIDEVDTTVPSTDHMFVGIAIGDDTFLDGDFTDSGVGLSWVRSMSKRSWEQTRASTHCSRLNTHG